MSRRRHALIALAGLIAAPMVIQKIQSTLSPIVNGSPVIALHKEPRPIGIFQFVGEDDRARSLSHYRGQYLLVNVWATWCPPCRTEMPSLDRLKAILGSSTGIDLLAIAVDRAPIAQIRAFYDQYEIKHLQLFHADETEVMSGLAVSGLPSTVLINRAGLEVGRLVGPTIWDSPELISQLSAFVPGLIADT